jgi:membrane-bound lytic murein transglycosylase B
LSLDFPTGRSDRSPFFQKELGHFLKLCDEQQVDPTTVLGSYAGAMGLPQFMPSSVRNFAVDFDGDGRIDLLRSPVDAIGSVARYLSEHGWQKDMPAYYEVKPPNLDEPLAKLLGPDIVPSFTMAEMQGMGASLSDAAQTHTGLLALVKLQNGEGAPTYIAGTDNFYAVTRYNQSSYYALAVIQLGQAVSQAAGNSP